jgi:hypothetical protein
MGCGLMGWDDGMYQFQICCTVEYRYTFSVLLYNLII